MFWWLCTLCEFLDASTDAYEEEEAEVYEEEEEPCANCTNCGNCTNQGKLILVQVSKDTLQFIYLGNFSHPKFYFAKLHFSQSIFIVDLCLKLDYYKSIKLSLDSWKFS